MSAFSDGTGALGRILSEVPTATAVTGDRTRRRIVLLVAVLVFGYSIVELVSLGFRHTTGPEVYGVLVAAVAVAAGAASLALLASSRRRVFATAAVLLLWAVVAVGGIAGTYAHIVGAPAGEGPVDPRPRPISAPLIFTALGLVGGAALVYGQRVGGPRLREP